MKVLLTAIAKAENNYLREWVKWNKRIGFTHIVLYDNNDKDGEEFADVIGDFIQEGFVEVINWRGKTCCQHAAYNDSYKRNGEKYDWLAFLDIDEFLRIDRIPFDRNVQRFLSQNIFDPYNGVKICWKLYDDNGLLRADGDYRCRERFTQAVSIENKQSRYAKTIVRGGLRGIEWKSSVHYPSKIYRVCDVLGNKTTASNKFDWPVWTKAVIEHYRYKTIEEYVQNKMRRLYADQTAESAKKKLTIAEFFTINERTMEKITLANQLLHENR